MENLISLINLIGSLIVATFLLSFLQQLSQIEYYNLVYQTISKITQPFIQLLKPLIPRFEKFDTISLLLAICCEIILVYLIEYIVQNKISPFEITFSIAIYRVINLLLNIYLYSMVIVAIMSWIAPFSRNPILTFTYQLVDPLAKYVRNFIPPIGGIDISFMIIMFIIIGIQHLLNNWIISL